MGKVIIIGAGPAGCSTAITIKKIMPELEVELFDQRPKLSKIECGEALSRRGVEENYDVIGKFFNKCVSRNVEKFEVIINDDLKKIVHSPGYMIDRNVFNKSLIKEAERLGCKVKMGHKAMPLSKDEKWKVKIENTYTHKSYLEECNMLVLAGGSLFRGVINTGIVNEDEYKKWRKDHVFGYQYKLLSPSYHEEKLLVDFRPNPTREIVYHYAFYHHGDESNFGLLYKGTFVSDRYYDKLLYEYLKKLGIKKVKLKERPTGNYIPGGGPLPKTYGDNVIVVGDNAGFANPIFYSGIHPALSSGRIAGKIIVEAFKSNDLSQNFLKEYENQWKKMPWGDPILVKGIRIHDKIRNKKMVSEEELEIYSKVLDITKDYGW